MVSVGSCVFRVEKVSVGPTWYILRGWAYVSHCSMPYRRMGSINWENSLLIRVADAVLSNMADSANVALGFLIIMEFRLLLELERHAPR